MNPCNIRKLHCCLFLCVLVILQACNVEQEKIPEMPKDIYIDVKNVDIAFETHKSPHDWNCDDIAGDRLCHPKSWVDDRKEHTVFICKIPNYDNSFFVILRYNINDGNKTIESHLRQVYENLRKSQSKKIISSEVIESLYNNGQSSIRGDYHVRYSDSEYYITTMYTAVDSFLYDFTLQAPYSLKEKMSEDFETIIYNYKRGDNNILAPDEVNKIKIIDVNNLDKIHS